MNLQSNESLNILQHLITSGIINEGSVLDTLMSIKRERMLKMHSYAITPPTSPKGRWQTYYKDETGKRKIIRAQTKEELLDKLIPIYFSNSHIDKLTFYGLYEEWLEYKATVTNSPNTITVIYILSVKKSETRQITVMRLWSIPKQTGIDLL